MSAAGQASTVELLGRLVEAVPSLFRKEVARARAEIDLEARRAARGVGLIAIAAILSLVALEVLAAALVSALTESGFDATTATLIVGGGAALLAIILLIIGMRTLGRVKFAPKDTIDSVRTDARTFKEAAE